MRACYNFLFIIFFVLSSPYYFFRLWRRGNWKTGFMQRFGKYDSKLKQSLTNRQVIWFHAVSVGEMNICTQLIRALEPRMPNMKIVVSTTTTTGMGELQKRLPLHVSKIYYPIDRKRCVNRALATIHPNAIVLVESEIWPNFIWRAKSGGIPLFLVNARMSDRSFPRYKRLVFLFRGLFGSFAAVGAQNEKDAARLREIGCKADAVKVVGNLKFDAAKMSGDGGLNVRALLGQLGVPADAQLLVAGSTHDGEEKILAEQFLRLRARFPKLFLVLVPRHFERANNVVQELTKLGITHFQRSQINAQTKKSAESVQCLLVDTTGELRYFYTHAAVVFVGKSLTAKGGQNPIEPAALGKAVVFGPNMQNFRDVVKIFLDGDAVVQVQNSVDLEKVFGVLLDNSKRCAELGRNAQKIVQENQGAVVRTVEMIVDRLKDKDFYIVAPK